MTRQARSLGAKGAEAALAGIEVRLLFTGKKRTQVARGRQGVGRGATLPPPRALQSDPRRMRPPQGIEHQALDSPQGPGGYLCWSGPGIFARLRALRPPDPTMNLHEFPAKG